MTEEFSLWMAPSYGKLELGVAGCLRQIAMLNLPSSKIKLKQSNHNLTEKPAMLRQCCSPLGYINTHPYLKSGFALS